MIDEPGPGERECPSCGFTVADDLDTCPYCGYEFPVRKASMTASAWLFVGLMVLFALPVLAWLLGFFG
ncbi:zinc ribbon domain-containing protein [Rubrivirga sp. IMCC43871]|uniref:zinc ribbon domain-containing protein n=1 Tax=Rubrivirga sp. IMCC43871 TaxID=3391575 RepID=UPI00398FBA49